MPPDINRAIEVAGQLAKLVEVPLDALTFRFKLMNLPNYARAIVLREVSRRAAELAAEAEATPDV
jgi:hypothetical protein